MWIGHDKFVQLERCHVWTDIEALRPSKSEIWDLQIFQINFSMTEKRDLAWYNTNFYPNQLSSPIALQEADAASTTGLNRVLVSLLVFSNLISVRIPSIPHELPGAKPRCWYLFDIKFIHIADMLK